MVSQIPKTLIQQTLRQNCQMNMEAHQSQDEKTTERTVPAPGTLHSEEELSSPDFQYLTEDSELEPETVYPDFAYKSMASFHIGVPDLSTFELLHDYLRPKAKNMNYWKGEAQVPKERQNSNATRSFTALF